LARLPRPRAPSPELHDHGRLHEPLADGAPPQHPPRDADPERLLRRDDAVHDGPQVRVVRRAAHHGRGHARRRVAVLRLAAGVERSRQVVGPRVPRAALRLLGGAALRGDDLQGVLGLVLLGRLRRRVALVRVWPRKAEAAPAARVVEPEQKARRRARRRARRDGAAGGREAGEGEGADAEGVGGGEGAAPEITQGGAAAAAAAAESGHALRGIRRRSDLGAADQLRVRAPPRTPLVWRPLQPLPPRK